MTTSNRVAKIKMNHVCTNVVSTLLILRKRKKCEVYLGLWDVSRAVDSVDTKYPGDVLSKYGTLVDLRRFARY